MKDKRTNAEIIELTKKYTVETYNPMPVAIVRGRGIWVWDIEGNKYIDMLSCYSAVSPGHFNLRILWAFLKQLLKLANISRAVYNPEMANFNKEICELTGYPKVLPMNIGTEAVDKAGKIAKKWGYLVKGVPLNGAEIISCGERCFHGRTLFSLALSDNPIYTKYFGPYPPGHVKIPFGDAEALEKAITKNTVAFIVEPIQAEGGVIVPPEGYLRRVKEICEKNNVLFVLDEIQTGLGRCGKLFAYEYENAKPDILILGKALGGGVGIISAALCSEKVADILKRGEDGSTFSGSPLCCAAAREALKFTVRKKLPERASELGNYFMEGLKKINSPYVKEVRGRGLLIAVEIKKEFGNARPFCLKLLKEELLCIETHDQSIRFSPPLVITKKEIDWALKRIQKVLTESLK